MPLKQFGYCVIRSCLLFTGLVFGICSKLWMVDGGVQAGGVNSFCIAQLSFTKYRSVDVGRPLIAGPCIELYM